MSLKDYEDFVYGAGLLNDPDPTESWRRVDREQQRIADFLASHDHIRIVAPGTEVSFGRAYPDTGGRNVSALHWDLICDLREGEVYADGELCYSAGKFNI